MIVIDQNGLQRDLDPRVGEPLMPHLRAMKIGIVGFCLGNAACGTCHVYVDDAHVAELPEPDEYEEQMLDELPSRKPNSRLSCQIVYDESIADATLTIAPR